MSTRRLLFYSLAALALLTATGAIAMNTIDLTEIQELAEEGLELLRTAPPIVFFSVMSFVCLFPIPITPFYLMAGPLFGIGPALAWIVPALALNQLVGHAAASSFLRPFIERFAKSRGRNLPRLASRSDEMLFVALVRITPGFPYFLQNVVLGLGEVERWRYLAISVPIQMVYATGFVVLGRSAFEGRLGMAIAALAFLVVALIAARMAHQRLQAAASES